MGDAIPSLTPAPAESNRRADCATREAARNRKRARRAMRAPSTGAIAPRATASRTVASTSRKSSIVRNEDSSIPRRSAGSAAAGGGKSCAASGRNRCGLRSIRSDTPARSTAERRDRACGAWGWECRAAGRAGCRNFPWRSARARRVRKGSRDQDQALEIPEFQARETGDNRTAKAGRQQFPASVEALVRTGSTYRFMVCSLQEPQLRQPNP
jgi:hypothetical protein